MIPERLIFIDLETTGMSPRRHRVIEVGLCEMVGGDVVSAWSTLVNPGGTLPPFIHQLTGITDSMVRDAPAFDEIADELLERISADVLVAHNARFDKGFLQSEFERLGIEFNPTMLCTVKLSRKLFPRQRRHSLDSIVERHGLLRPADRHRALADARLTAAFYGQLLETQAEADLVQAIGEQLKRPSLPAHIPRERIEEIPRGPGVYLFYGENQTPLYIGKSVDLKSRVLSHFAPGNRDQKGQRLAQQVQHIDWRQTAGELGALLLESKLVKQFLPVHNRRLRRSRDLFTIVMEPGASRIRTVPLRELEGEGLAEMFGVFRTRRQVDRTLRELAREQGLCLKTMGWEQGAGACFNYQLKRCRGACVGREEPTLHRLRLMQALASFRLAAWPFSGPVGIKETSSDRQRTEIHVVDQWCHWGSVGNEADLRALLEVPTPACFDLDSYRILAGFLRRSPPRAEIIPLAGK